MSNWPTKICGLCGEKFTNEDSYGLDDFMTCEICGEMREVCLYCWGIDMYKEIVGLSGICIVCVRDQKLKEVLGEL